MEDGDGHFAAVFPIYEEQSTASTTGYINDDDQDHQLHDGNSIIFRQQNPKKIHDGPLKVLSCPYPKCQFMTDRPVTLKSHRNSHRKCEICFKEFSGRRSNVCLRRHMEQHRRNTVGKKGKTCQYCGKIYPFHSYLRRHLVKCPKYLEKKPETKTNDSDILRPPANFDVKEQLIDDCTFIKDSDSILFDKPTDMTRRNK
jgi:hypothetical protein